MARYAFSYPNAAYSRTFTRHHSTRRLIAHIKTSGEKSASDMSLIIVDGPTARAATAPSSIRTTPGPVTSDSGIDARCWPLKSSTRTRRRSPSAFTDWNCRLQQWFGAVGRSLASCARMDLKRSVMWVSCRSGDWRLDSGAG